MNRILLACLAVSLAGCGTIFDPAPYSPLTDKPLLASLSPPATPLRIRMRPTPSPSCKRWPTAMPTSVTT